MKNKTLTQILHGLEVNGRSDKTYEDARVYEDIPPLVNFIHKFVVKPISYYGSSRTLQKEVLKAIGNPRGLSIIDVSAGGDETILHVEGARKVVANDIVPRTMEPLRQKAPRRIIYTSKNLLEMDGREKYNVVLCKNTLHHMNTVTQMETALNKLKKLKKKNGKIVIVDIENPSLSAKARLWNAYYVFMLKDQGGFFINYDQFCDMLACVFEGMTIKTKIVDTVKGRYMFSEIY